MQTRFAEGQQVVSNVNAQGLKQGHVYTVTDVAVRSTPFGGFTTYTVEDSEGNEFSVGNGHLVLREKEDWSLEAFAARCSETVGAQAY